MAIYDGKKTAASTSAHAPGQTAAACYNLHALLLELQNLQFFSKNKIFNFVCGDDSSLTSAYLNPRRSNKFVETYHFLSKKFHGTTIGPRQLAAMSQAACSPAESFDWAVIAKKMEGL